MSEQGKKKAVAPVLQNMQDYISNHYRLHVYGRHLRNYRDTQATI